VKPGRVVLRREKAHRGGKTVLVVDGFGEQHTEAAIESLGKRLRAACGCGGTFRERSLEVQGDQPARVRAFLEAEGFQVAGEK
jgi:translation initiation factor 1